MLGAFVRQGASFRDAVDLANRFGAEAAGLQEAWLLSAYRRQPGRRRTEYTVEGIESMLDEMGLYERTRSSGWTTA